MKEEIKETCSCGAVLEYKEEKNEVWQFTDTSHRQADFHKAHKSCREVQINGLPIEPKELNP